MVKVDFVDIMLPFGVGAVIVGVIVGLVWLVVTVAKWAWEA